MTRLLTIGTFDLPHIGHAAFLRRCERYADTVTVGVNSDAFVERYKGRRPLFDQDERMELIRSLGYSVALNDGPGRDLILGLAPDVLAIGSDWGPPRDYHAQVAVEQAELDARGISLIYIPCRPAGISATEVRRRCLA